MPWEPGDADKHKKGLTKAEKEKWAKIANSVLEECLDNGGKKDYCEGKAIRIANSKVGKNKNEGGDRVNKKMLKVPKGGFQFVSEEPTIAFKDVDEDGKPKSFSMEAYTGAIMPDIFGGSIAVDVSGIEFDGKKRFPILEDHLWENKIGVSNNKPNMENNRVSFDNIKILSNEKAQEFAQNLVDGFPYQASISIRPRKIEEVPEGESADVNGMKMKGPGVILRTSTFREASVCVFGRDSKTSVKSLSDSDYDEVEVECVNFSETDDWGKEYEKKNKDGGKNMNLNEILDKVKTDFSEEAYDTVNAAFQEKDRQITDLTKERDDLTKERDDLKKEKDNLSEENKQVTARVGNLEKYVQLRKEQDLKSEADQIVDSHLKESNVPERLHDKVKKQLNHNDFIQKDENEENYLDVEKFTEAVKAEVKDWSETLSDPTILGFTPNQDFNDHKKEDGKTNSDSLSDELAGYAGYEAKKE